MDYCNAPSVYCRRHIRNVLVTVTVTVTVVQPGSDDAARDCLSDVISQ